MHSLPFNFGGWLKVAGLNVTLCGQLAVGIFAGRKKGNQRSEKCYYIHITYIAFSGVQQKYLVGLVF